MTKEEYFELLINGKIVELMNMDDEEEKRLSREVMENAPFNTLIPKTDKSVLENALSGIDNAALALALKFATEQTKEKIFSVLSDARSKAIEEQFDFIGPEIFKRVIENQEIIIEKIKAVSRNQEGICGERQG